MPVPVMQPLTLFTHVPKTGGTSVVERLAAACPGSLLGPELRALAAEDYGFNIGRALLESRHLTTDATLLSGHLPPTAAALFTGRAVRLAVFLRDPIDRTISALRHSVAKVPPEAYPTLAVVMRAGGLLDNSTGTEIHLLDACIERGFCANVTTQQLSGLADLSAIELTEDDLAAGLLFKPNFASRSRLSSMDLQDMLAAAATHLDRDYGFIGFQSEHERSLSQLAAMMGVTPGSQQLRRRKTDARALRLDRSDPAIEDRLRTLNEYDDQLYKRAASRSQASAVA